MRWILVFCVVLITTRCHKTVEIDNGIVGEPQVQCEADAISLLFTSKNSFIGKVFVKDDGCIQMGDQKTAHRFTVKHDACGSRRQREVNGVVIVTTVIISFHSIFITKIDRAYKLSCFYVEASKKVSQQLDVASLTTQALEGQTQLPVCRYEILGEINGPAIKYAHIGDIVYHKWSCASEMNDVYCMRVHSCSVNDGQGGPPVTVLDINGCSIDGVILQDLDYIDDLTAGKPAPVFKFADKAGLYFNCQVQLTIKDKILGCGATQPTCMPQTYVEPAGKATEVASGEYTESSHESGYPTKSIDIYGSTTEEVSSEEAMKTTTSIPVALRLVGAPGAQPSYEDFKLNGEKPPKVEEKEPYSRLLRRNIRDSNRTKPITVADFDLPEKGLIVFGLDDGENQEDTTNASQTARAFLNDRKISSTCFSTNRLITILVICMGILVVVTTTAIVIVLRQRRMISRSFKP